MYAIKGDLSQLSFMELLQVVGRLSKSGALTLEKGGECLIFTIRHGFLIEVDSFPKIEEFRVGRILIQHAKITEDQLKSVLALKKSTGQKTGRILIAQHYCDNDAVRNALETQALQLLFRAMKWKTGNYHFQSERAPAPKDGLRNPVSPESIQLSTSSLIDEWSLLHEIIGDENGVFGLRVNEILNINSLEASESYFDSAGIGLTKTDLMVLKLVDGKNSINQIAHLYGYAEFVIYRSLVNLLNRGLIQRIGIRDDLPHEEGNGGNSTVAKETTPLEQLQVIDSDNLKLTLDDILIQYPFILAACLYNPNGTILLDSSTNAFNRSILEQLVYVLCQLSDDYPRSGLNRVMIEDSVGTVLSGRVIKSLNVMIIADKATSLGVVSMSLSKSVQAFEKIMTGINDKEDCLNGHIEKCTQ